MLHRASKLFRFQIAATDGSLGRIEDAYFDDEAWVLRYFIADTGRWLSGRKVLISMHSVSGIDETGEAIITTLSRAQVQASPSIDTSQRISRQQEASFLRYFGYPFYWPAASLGGWGEMESTNVVPEAPESGEAFPAEPEDAAAAAEEDMHLRSCADVIGYHVEGEDEPVGHVVEVLVEDGTWAVRYLGVDTRNWLPGRRVLISPQWIRGVSWSERTVDVDLPRAAIEGSPQYDPDHLPTRDYEAELHRHYQRPSYFP